MAPLIRPATPTDAASWLELLQTTLGPDYPAGHVYQLDWVARQLSPASRCLTWIAEDAGRCLASLSLLAHTANNPNPIFNLGRHLNRPESYHDGSAEALLRSVCALADEHGQWSVGRVQAADNPLQLLYEQLGFQCVGYQPAKHLLPVHSGTLFYVRPGQPELQARLPLSESLPQVSEMAACALQRIGVAPPLQIRDGATGYPLQLALQVHEAGFADFELWRSQARTANPVQEISTGFNTGWGYLRIPTDVPPRVLLGQRDERMVTGLAYTVDETDQCLRIIDGYAVDDLSLGALLLELSRRSMAEGKTRYLELDGLMTAPRLLKTAEQLGFIPVAYLPAFFVRQSRCEDVVKLIKLNQAYAPESFPLTTQAQAMAAIVDRNFQDLKGGVAVINMLRALAIFDGLGDGELRKIARLFEQKLYRAGEMIFRQGDSRTEAYIVLRGEVDIFINQLTKPVATLSAGQVFGELAFLEGTPRTASAVARQPVICLVVKRADFYELVQREPHLGMVIMRNVALDLSQKLRHTNQAMGLRQSS